jgi:uncharacterized protein GlcG (DUF336 family)
MSLSAEKESEMLAAAREMIRVANKFNLCIAVCLVPNGDDEGSIGVFTNVTRQEGAVVALLETAAEKCRTDMGEIRELESSS